MCRSPLTALLGGDRQLCLENAKEFSFHAFDVSMVVVLLIHLCICMNDDGGVCVCVCFADSSRHMRMYFKIDSKFKIKTHFTLVFDNNDDDDDDDYNVVDFMRCFVGYWLVVRCLPLIEFRAWVESVRFCWRSLVT